MSKGLGKLQRDILASLDAAKASAKQDHTHYKGQGASCQAQLSGLQVIYDGRDITLAPDVYDLRASCKFLAEKNGATDYGSIKPSFQAAFSRAVRRLVAADYLASDPKTHHKRQVRLVRKGKCYGFFLNAYRELADEFETARREAAEARESRLQSRLQKLTTAAQEIHAVAPAGALVRSEGAQ